MDDTGVISTSGHNNNKETNVDDMGVISDSGHNNNSNARSNGDKGGNGLNNSKEKKEDDSSGAFSDSGHNNTNGNNNVLRDDAKGGIGGIGKIPVVGHNNNSEVEIEDTTGGISDVGRNNNEKSDDDNFRGVRQGSSSAPAMAAIFTTTAANAASKRMTGVGNDNE